MKRSFWDVFKIFAAFFKIGAFTFGGGYAMIPLIQKEAVENTAGSAMMTFWRLLLLQNPLPARLPSILLPL